MVRITRRRPVKKDAQPRKQTGRLNLLSFSDSPAGVLCRVDKSEPACGGVSWLGLSGLAGFRNR